MIRHIWNMLNNAQDIDLLLYFYFFFYLFLKQNWSFLSMFLVTILVISTSLVSLPDSINNFSVTLTFGSAIRIPLVMLIMERWSNHTFVTFDWEIDAELWLFCESLNSHLELPQKDSSNYLSCRYSSWQAKWLRAEDMAS